MNIIIFFIGYILYKYLIYFEQNNNFEKNKKKI